MQLRKDIFETLIQKMAAAIRKVGDHVQEGLDKIREKPWAEPLGKALATGAKIVTRMDGLVPGIALLGGAMAMGASLLNPEPSVTDLHKELKEINQLLQDKSLLKATKRAYMTQQKKLQTLIENPIGEVQSNFNEIKNEMKNILKYIEEQNMALSDEITTMKDMIGQTYLMIADVKYQVYSHTKQIIRVHFFV